MLLAGVITRPFHLSATGTVDLLGVRFQPAGAWPLAPGDMDGLVDAWAEPAGRESWHEVLESTGPRTGADRVEALWEPLRRTDSDRRARRGDAVLRAANRIVDAASDERVGDVARAVGLSPRQLERRFRREVGVTPKVLSRVARFQRALRHLTGPDALPAAQAAVAGLRSIYPEGAKEPLGRQPQSDLQRSTPWTQLHELFSTISTSAS